MRKKGLTLIIIVLFILSGCSKLDLQEWDGISYNSSIYSVGGEWYPLGKKLGDKISVNLEDYDGYVNIKDGYTAYGYEGDIDHVFLYFYGQIYVKKGYAFPDIVDDIDSVQKIVICDTLWSRLKGIYAVIYDRNVISMFTMEYRGNMGEIRNQKGKDFEIRYFFKDFFAYYASYNIMGKSSDGHFGFLADSVTGFKIRLVSNDLNQILSDKIK